MVILKRLAVWLLERSGEALFLGILFGYLLLHNLKTLFPDALKFGVIVAVVLFMHGYYATTALAGVVFRSRRWWLYPAIAAALLVIHTCLIFLHGDTDLTPEMRAAELPFVLIGACIVFACSLAGGRVLERWVRERASTTPYLSATGITLLVFGFMNAAHFLRPAGYDDSFRPYGIPFIFYRDGGFVGNGYVWQGGRWIWSGVVADAAFVAVSIVLLGMAWQRIAADRAAKRERTD